MKLIKILVALVLVVGMSACTSADNSGDATVEDEGAAEATTSPPAYDEDNMPDDTPTHTEPPPPPDKHHLVKRDVKVTPRIKSKQCFGSAGCSVELAVSLGWTIPDPGKLDGTYDVTYTLTGDEDGPVIETLTVYPNGRYDVPYDASLYPPYSSTPIRAIVTRVTKID